VGAALAATKIYHPDFKQLMWRYLKEQVMEVDEEILAIQYLRYLNFHRPDTYG